MKKKKIKTSVNYTKVLQNRIYNTLLKEQIRNYFLDGEPIMKWESIADVVNANINNFLTAEEQKHLIIQNLGLNETPDMNLGMLNLSILLV